MSLGGGGGASSAGRGCPSGRSAGRVAASVATSAANGSEADVGVDNLGVGRLSFDLGGNTRAGRAASSLGARGGSSGVCWVGGIQPKHVDRVLREPVSNVTEIISTIMS